MHVDDLMQALPETYLPADRELILRAYRLAEQAHHDQRRASGEPYVNHCLSVSMILAELRVPPEVIAAGLLHDTVEDTSISLGDLRRDFGEDIAKLVDGVQKINSTSTGFRGA